VQRRETVGGLLPDGFALFFVRAAHFVLNKIYIYTYVYTNNAHRYYLFRYSMYSLMEESKEIVATSVVKMREPSPTFTNLKDWNVSTSF